MGATIAPRALPDPLPAGGAGRPAGLIGRLRLPRSWAFAEGCLAAEWTRLPLWLPVAFGCGIVAYFSLDREPGLEALWLALPMLLAALLLLRRHPLAAWFASSAGLALLGLGVAAWHAHRLPPMPDLPNKAVVVEGVVESVDALAEGLRVTLTAPRLSADSPPLLRNLRIRLRAKDALVPEPGDHLRVRALIRAPAPPAYPGAWDFQRNAFFSGLGGSGFAIGEAERLEEAAPAGSSFARLRQQVEARVRGQIPGGAGAVASALLTGSQSAIPATDLDAMRDSGLAHLLSVSGLHIAIVMGLSFGILRWLLAFIPWLALRGDSRALAAPGSLIVGLGYVLLTGAQVPMLRSFAMAALVTLGILIGRRALSLRALAVAAAAVMLLQPDAVMGASFQMSFAAVMVLIAGNEWAGPTLRRWRAGAGWWRKPALLLLGLVMTSVLAGAATTPFGLHHFGRLQVYGVLSNAVAIPLTSILVMPAGMAAMALMPLGLEHWALVPMGWGVEATLFVAHAVAAWPGAALAAAPIPAWGLGLTAFGLIWLCLWQRRWRLLGVPMMVLGLASAAWVTPPDILVSGDARLIAFRTPDAVYLQRASGASGLTRDSWLRSWGEEAATPVPAEGRTEEGAMDCTLTACRFQPRPDVPAAMLLRLERAPRRNETAPPVQAGEHCGRSEVMISPEPIRGRCRSTAVVDRFSVWRDGPHAIWLTADGVRIVSDRAWRGQRPWVPPPPRPAAERAAQ
ncbi:ComEC/Rec2 family competence protein [Roseomonas haemaphysalidis]|uniref:ComEC/Rec2 family competence protein n=1 Tax=Roseomonas haemaphysalidis TaxID=2768162 RepID=A0ABS3KSB5_9PROT|nr:ComEC/Rec2 family competence protein [Roseomonas haemaphysalidis]MBO1080356.1 ComEC/Rec2 family competence protein [Roseomonas haemaphysalidis]